MATKKQDPLTQHLTEIEERVLPEVEKARADADKALVNAKKVQITSDKKYELAAEYLKDIGASQDKLETEKKVTTGPLNEWVKKINSKYTGALNQYEEARRAVKGAMTRWLREKEEKQQKLIDEVERASVMGKNEKAAELVQQLPEASAPRIAGVSMREVWHYEVIDQSKLKPEHLMPNEKLIGAIVRGCKSEKEALEILGPGVKVWSEKTLAA